MFSSLANAIVIRHDVPQQHYDASLSDFPPLATLYNIGVHGTLIAPDWVLTAAHTVFCMNPGQSIKVGNELVKVSQRFSYPEYRLGKQHDIALLRLSKPVTSVKPAEVYNMQDEQGQVVWFIGAGGFGTGDQGETVNYKDNKGKLRKAQNRIVKVTDSDIVFKFEKGSNGEALEGVSGNGDCGGPTYIKQDGRLVLLGVSSRTDSWFYDVGEYGVTELYTRVSSYQSWIERVIGAQSDAARRQLASLDPFLHENMEEKKMEALCSSLSFEK
ncbi:trypsin-like serine protease [Pseudoalteromonas sp. DL2-H2.2]|uniref:S1 family peptidase n=1 Tax=Pseudoalteromonas sp. DL2-H2.2 TaxID=2908889 RepID=UPI001F2C7871|nr:trypsin-like serine protease [Pseudoalteromonas sp. DL2-H2.2]MCF2909250.1 trypsin-like serine protease [Pseudoalteromonas sp. DL2-H2.2]